MEFFKEYILENCYNSIGRVNNRAANSHWWEKRGKLEIYQFILDYTDFLPESATFSNRIWHIMNGVDVPRCLECGIETKWKPSGGYTEFCSNNCVNKSNEVKYRRSVTYVQNFGVDNPFKSTEIKDKIRSTNLEKYGTECVLQSEEIKLKSAMTMRNRYGCNHPMHSSKIRKKLANTNLEKYGHSSPLSAKCIRDKIERTNFEKYGKAHAVASKVVRERIIETNLKNHGHTSSLKSVKVRNKIISTNMERYGVEFPTQSSVIQDKIRKKVHSHVTDDIYDRLYDREWLQEQHHNLRKPLSQISTELGLSTTVVGKYVNNHGISVVRFRHSVFEKEVFESIQKFVNTDIRINDRDIIAPLELDFYIPEYNLAIECNGSYWHSELQGKDRNYHLNKTKLCEEKEIRLIQIWQHEWNAKRDIIARYIMSIIDGSDTMG
jgi:very-short-patch-repair endonuclease